MSELAATYLTTKELAELLRIKERKVYDLVAAGDIPCTRATGKLLFPRQAVEAWLVSKGSGLAEVPSGTRPNVFLGSHDPLLEWALRESGAELACFFDGSQDGLERFIRQEGVATGLHLLDADSGEWNREVAQRFADAPVVQIEFVRRERGLVVPAEAQARIRCLRDLAGQRLAPRQNGAGSQVLLACLIEQAGLSISDFTYTSPARSEADAALAVLDGSAAAALGLRAQAAQYRLGFVPLVQERFDLLLDRRAWFEPPLQALIRFCQSRAFQNKAEALGGYDASRFGQVVFNGP